MRQAYRRQDLSGVRTVVKDPTPDTGSNVPGKDERKPQALPSPQWTNTTKTGPHNFNTPGPSGTGEGGKSIHKDKARTQGTPGGEHPGSKDPPSAQTAPGIGTRRPGLSAEGEKGSQLYDGIMPTEEQILSVLQRYRVREAAITGPPYPGAHRQKKQRGQAKRYFQKWYRRNKSKVRTRMKRWYQRFKNRGRYKRDQARRDENPERFERKPGGARSVKQRSQEYRKEKKQKGDRAKKAGALLSPVEFFHLPTHEWGHITGVSEQTGLVTFQVEGLYQSRPLEEFFDEAVVDDDAFFEYLDQALGYDEEDEIDWEIPELGDDLEMLHGHAGYRQDVLSMSLTAEMLYERVDRQDPPENSYDRATDRKKRKDDREKSPRTLNDITPVTDNPGSAKVIPEGHGFQNKQEKKFGSKTAYRISQILENVDESVQAKAAQMPVKLRKVDAANGMWLFDVAGNSDVYRVRVKGVVSGSAKRLSKADVYLSCSCPFWRWQGPEHWAKQKGYLYGKPRGTASFPEIKDPAHEHGVCKHVLAVLNHALANDWRVPEQRRKQGSSSRYLSDMLSQGEVWAVFAKATQTAATKLVSRYLERKQGGRNASIQL